VEKVSNIGQIQKDHFEELKHCVLQLLSCSLSEFVGSFQFFEASRTMVFDSHKKEGSIIHRVLANSKLEETPYFLKKSRSWLKLLLTMAEIFPVPFVVCDMSDADRPLVYANPEFLSCWGFEMTDILGEGISTLAGDETKSDVLKEISQKSSEKIAFTVESIWSKKDSSSIKAKVLFLPIWTEQHIELAESGSDIEGDEEIADAGKESDDDALEQFKTKSKEDFTSSPSAEEETTVGMTLSSDAMKQADEMKAGSLLSPSDVVSSKASSQDTLSTPPIKYYFMLFIPLPAVDIEESLIEAIEKTYFKLPTFAPTKNIWKIETR